MIYVFTQGVRLACQTWYQLALVCVRAWMGVCMRMHMYILFLKNHLILSTDASKTICSNPFCQWHELKWLQNHTHMHNNPQKTYLDSDIQLSTLQTIWPHKHIVHDIILIPLIGWYFTSKVCLEGKLTLLWKVTVKKNKHQKRALQVQIAGLREKKRTSSRVECTHATWSHLPTDHFDHN